MRERLFGIRRGFEIKRDVLREKYINRSGKSNKSEDIREHHSRENMRKSNDSKRDFISNTTGRLTIKEISTDSWPPNQFKTRSILNFRLKINR